MVNIIVLGGSGFIGKSLVDRLEKTNSTNTTVMVHSTKIKTRLKKFQGSILDTTLRKNINTDKSKIRLRIESFKTGIFLLSNFKR